MAGTPSGRHHKPRRKVKNGDGKGFQLSKAETLIRTPSFPLSAFLWPARGSVSQWEVLPLILMIVGLFMWAAGLWGYSGFEKPPMFGDYEAQRHWMEITTQLPISSWYFYDLEWWGLDYPPLTAYHSWLCGKFGTLIDPSWFALYTSRGIHDANLKIFMRATVIVSEYLIFVPAVVMFVRRFGRLHGVSNWTISVALVAVLMQPGTILIDHVHFQYNTVMLGFVIASMSSMLAGRFFWASVFFVAALGFKQMALYYALPVFFFLLGSCLFPQIRITRLLAIALGTVVSFAVLLLPLVAGALYDKSQGASPRADLQGPDARLPIFQWIEDYVDTNVFYWPVIEQLVQVIHRVFPFARGLFEDKVANFWCALNVVIKLRQYPSELLQKASLVATLAFSLIPSLILFFKPKRELLPLGFATTAWAFFLFSFQVHEKSVLLPLMPMTLLLAGNNGLGKDTRAWVGFANILGSWTMFPLLQRVDLRVPYAVITGLWAYLLGLPPTSLGAYFENGSSALTQWTTFLLHGGFYLAMAAWHVLEGFVAPPLDKPDLWTVLNVGIGAAGFGLSKPKSGKDNYSYEHTGGNRSEGLTKQMFPAQQDVRVIMAGQPCLHCMPHAACRLPHAPRERSGIETMVYNVAYATPRHTSPDWLDGTQPTPHEPGEHNLAGRSSSTRRILRGAEGLARPPDRAQPAGKQAGSR